MKEKKDIQFEGQHEDKTSVQYNDQPKTKKKSNKGFIIGYIILFIILIGITSAASILTISYINKKRNENQEITIIDNNKKEAEDAKYGIKSFTETYNSNSLKIKDLFDINGEIYEKFPEGNNSQFVHYIEIDGLKDKSVQNKINKQLKDTAYNIKNDSTYTIVKGNFANILSVEILNESGLNEENSLKTFNFDLSTGEQIPFEKVFVSSATINSYLSDALYEILAWDNVPQNDSLTESTDMKDIDTSSFEDKFLLLINKYNEAKENGDIRYSISPSGVNVYGLLDKSLISEEAVKYYNLEIDFINCKEEVAIYKRYLTDKSIFSDDSIGYKNTIVFTGSNIIEQYYDRIYYGKVKDNLFAEEIMYKNEEDSKEKGYENALKYVKKLSEDNREKMKRNIFDNKGIIYQRDYSIGYDERGFFRVAFTAYKMTCPITYFEEEAFKAYIDTMNMPTADISPNFVSYVDPEKYPNVKLEDPVWEEYYLDRDGKLIGRTEEEATSRLNIDDEYNVNNTIVENTIGNMVSNSTVNTTGNTIGNSTSNITNNIINNTTNNAMSN